MERIDEERMAKNVVNCNVEGNRCRGRPRLGRMNGVKRAFMERGMSMEHG